MKTRRVLAVSVMVSLLVGLVATATAAAHQERESEFPDPNQRSAPPTYRAYDAAADNRVVCKADSAERIAAMTAPELTEAELTELRAFNETLLADCRFAHIQAAVDAVEAAGGAGGSNIYVLPGLYREEPSWAPPCTFGYDGGKVEYDEIHSCGEVLNLVTIAGDTDGDGVCDGALCDLQIEGTGASAEDVVLRGGFISQDDWDHGPDLNGDGIVDLHQYGGASPGGPPLEVGDWIKHNGLKADRADGIYVTGLTGELFRENALYVHETSGYVLDDVIARHNDLYGILTFTADRGEISNCEAYNNGDSGVYPGSSADVNGDSTTPQVEPITRWSVEIFGCDIHHNALGHSGTAGNSVNFHDNVVRHNGAGYVTDSFVGGHPGMPQDHAWIHDNLIYANNEDYYANVRPGGACVDKLPAERGYEPDERSELGVVCPAFGVPVGTGVLIAGGSYNRVDNNQIFDNWRNGTMMFWIPGAIRGDVTPQAQIDTSNGNRQLANIMGFHPSGAVQPNGLDFWWDDQGIGNCWQGNTSSTPGLNPDATLGDQVTHNALAPVLPLCEFDGQPLPGSQGPPNAPKSAGLVPCAEYNREDNPDPVGCDWFRTPPEPRGRVEATTSVDYGAPDRRTATVLDALRAGAIGQETSRPVSDPVSDEDANLALWALLAMVSVIGGGALLRYVSQR